jgi:hypothetical protein
MQRKKIEGVLANILAFKGRIKLLLTFGAIDSSLLSSLSSFAKAYKEACKSLYTIYTWRFSYLCGLSKMVTS